MTTENANKLYNHLLKIEQTNLTIKQYQTLNNLNDRFIYNKISELKKNKEKTPIFY